MSTFPVSSLRAERSNPESPLPNPPPQAGEGRLGTACFVYVLGCVHRGRALTYVGWSNDVARRLAQHNAGRGARTTRGRAWILLHTEAFATRGEAMSREWHLKRDRAFRKALAEEMRGI